jgi:hypothetical protein
MLMAPLTAGAATQATGHLTLEGGRSYPQKELAEWLEPGPAYRAEIFGGAKVNVPMIGAVGLGLDLTYSFHHFKDAGGDDQGHYQRFLWDWFFLPINIGFLNVTPGIAWVVTDIDAPALGVEELSVRPAAVLSLGLRVGILPHLALTADVRGEKVLLDQERLDADHQLNITGEFVTALAGIMAYF